MRPSTTKETTMTIKNPTPKPSGQEIENFGNGIIIKWNIFK
jgi:hypothetical protein